MGNKRYVLLIGLATIISISVYVLFRLSSVTKSLWLSEGFFQMFLVIIFFLSEAFILLHAAGYFINILRSTLKYKRSYIPYGNISKKPPAVSIIIPTHDEPISILRKTVVASKFIDYENKKIIIVDSCEDSVNSKMTKKLCDEFGVDYFLVPKPRHGAKAGSINELLPSIKSTYIAIFDADFRSSRNFLKLLVAQMEENKKLAYIQTPQFYGNLRESEVSRAAQLQQSIFYEYICEGKSITGGMFMCGTNMIIRTKALREVGGFLENSITEDFATSFLIHSRGWQSSYFNFATAFGDGPLNVEEYLRQQYRWARGSIGVFLTILGPLLRARSISAPAKIEYILAGSYYFVGIVWMVFILLPVFYIFFRVPAYLSDPFFYVLTYLPYFLLSTIFFMLSILKRHYHLLDWLKSQSLAFLAIPTYAQAALDALLNRQAKFEKTQKDVEIDTLYWPGLLGPIILTSLCFLALIASLGEVVLYGLNTVLALNIWWTFFHVFILTYLLIFIYVKKNKLA